MRNLAAVRRVGHMVAKENECTGLCCMTAWAKAVSLGSTLNMAGGGKLLVL